LVLVDPRIKYAKVPKDAGMRNLASGSLFQNDFNGNIKEIAHYH